MTPFEKEMEQNLLELRSNLLAKISKSDSDFQNLVGSSGTGDSVDIASDDLASKKMEAIGKIDAGKLNAINQALVRIRNGKYGVCAMCGKKIPEDRLRASPYENHREKPIQNEPDFPFSSRNYLQVQYCLNDNILRFQNLCPSSVPGVLHQFLLHSFHSLQKLYST